MLECAKWFATCIHGLCGTSMTQRIDDLDIQNNPISAKALLWLSLMTDVKAPHGLAVRCLRPTQTTPEEIQLKLLKLLIPVGSLCTQIIEEGLRDVESGRAGLQRIAHSCGRPSLREEHTSQGRWQAQDSSAAKEMVLQPQTQDRQPDLFLDSVCCMIMCMVSRQIIAGTCCRP